LAAAAFSKAGGQRHVSAIGVNLLKVGFERGATAPRASRVIREPENIRPQIGFVPDNPCRDRLSPIVDSWATLPTKKRLYTMISRHNNRHPSARPPRATLPINK
jgi:hypothetical protein